jgi:hypothetical protein
LTDCPSRVRHSQLRPGQRDVAISKWALLLFGSSMYGTPFIVTKSTSPVSISNSTAPKAQMSARLSTVFPRNTLVVETTNFTDKVNYRGLTVFGTGKNVHLVERFTRVDADTIDYQFTVDDATVFTRPWTAAIPMTQIKGPLFEYACHEGNYGLPQILSGPRVQEKAEGAANKGPR